MSQGKWLQFLARTDEWDRKVFVNIGRVAFVESTQEPEQCLMVFDDGDHYITISASFERVVERIELITDE